MLALIPSALTALGLIGGSTIGASGRIASATIAAEGKLRAIAKEREDSGQQPPRKVFERPKLQKKKGVKKHGR
ncbi:MAG: hypothetical protein ACREBU_05280 [Nitrososphaera sp.]